MFRARVAPVLAYDGHCKLLPDKADAPGGSVCIKEGVGRMVFKVVCGVVAEWSAVPTTSPRPLLSSVQVMVA